MGPMGMQVCLRLLIRARRRHGARRRVQKIEQCLHVPRRMIVGTCVCKGREENRSRKLLSWLCVSQVVPPPPPGPGPRPTTRGPGLALTPHGHTMGTKRPDFKPGTLFVAGFSPSTTTDALSKYCSKWGKLKECFISDTKKYGFVQFVDPKNAIAFLDHQQKEPHMLEGRRMDVRAQTPKGQVCAVHGHYGCPCIATEEPDKSHNDAICSLDRCSRRRSTAPARSLWGGLGSSPMRTSRSTSPRLGASLSAKCCARRRG